MPALLWSALIFILCFIPGSSLPQDDWLDQIHVDKFVHAGLYFVLFLLILFGASSSGVKQLLLAGAICLVQGLAIEWLQGTITVLQRSFDGWDIAANLAGIVAAAGFARRTNLI